MANALAQVVSSSRYADLFEFRLDLINAPRVDTLLGSTKKPTIAVCRPVWEGGAFRGSERKRLALLLRAVQSGAQYVDIEFRAFARINKDLVRGSTSRVIVSVHVADMSPVNVSSLYRRLHRTGADIIKLAYPALDASDIRYAIEFLSLARLDRRKAVAVAMGQKGEASRVLYRKFGGWATYAAPENGKAAADGQLPARDLRELYRAHTLTRGTKVFGVIGNPLGQSKGIHLHNPLFVLAGRNAVYCKFPVMKLSAFMQHIAPHLSGFSVTIPHKQSIVSYLARLDPAAAAIGAVNTVVRQQGELVGKNSDAPGALDAIEEVVRVRDKTVLIVGAGGAARAIVYEAKRRGATVLVTNRTERKARDLAKSFEVKTIRKEQLPKTEFDILVNATSVGMSPARDATLVPQAILKGKIVFDVVYNPPMTKLLRDAKNVGAKIIQGTAMYMNQAARQCKLYAGFEPETRTIRKLLGW